VKIYLTIKTSKILSNQRCKIGFQIPKGIEKAPTTTTAATTTEVQVLRKHIAT